MYWNNLWVNTFNTKNFFNKTLFLENIFYFLFSDKVFKFFFLKKFSKTLKNFSFFKDTILTKKNKIKKNVYFKRKKPGVRKHVKYNFTKVWLIKFNNFILISTFVFFYFKVKKKKKTYPKVKFKVSKIITIFWNKEKGWNFKRKAFLKNNYLVF